MFKSLTISKLFLNYFLRILYFLFTFCSLDSLREKKPTNEKIKHSLKKRNKSKGRKKREIRLFVSSTFRDFVGEREELIKKTFQEVS